ncbi:hypothetical protein P3T36_006280 [Kitasatospora sp. MAP12-15]|uniref:hypothetical protein n=1 Tax=unclassified Kitasatospora TaxID=2633591 RepID=UPI002474E624|nr:hypothetical protein [Kitasatospora sp. MAP12-44]MDH6108927.1 hypothetical protein [Kitasatospora sp. MAP12-44]
MAQAEHGFELAAVFDTVDPVTGPGFAADHPRITDPAERTALLDYLRAGPAVLMTPMLMDDVLEPSRLGRVPMSYRTDGVWIWTDTITYYLEEYGLAPEPGLLAHLRQRVRAGVGPSADADADVLERAVAFILTPPPEEEAEPVWTLGGSDETL